MSPSAVSDWPCRSREGIAGPLLSTASGEGDAGASPQRPINHNCFNSINDVFAGLANASDKCHEFVGVFPSWGWVQQGAEQGARPRRALLPCLALTALGRNPRWPRADADAGHAAPGARRFLAPQDSPLRPTRGSHRSSAPPDPASDPRPRNPDKPAPSRVGRIPTYGLPAASGASDSGYDSLNRKRKKPKYYPGQARPKPPPGPGTPAARRVAPIRTAGAAVGAAVGERQQDAAPAGDGRHRRRPAAAQAA